jgi:hypothetical protein
MATVREAVQHTAEQQAEADRKAKLAQAKPALQMFQHIVATQAAQTGFIITLIDGTSYTAEQADSFFADGLSIVHDKRRIYFPTTAIKSILIRNPGDK